MAEPLAELLDVVTKEQVLEVMISVWQDLEFPVTAWLAGDAARTMAEAVAAALGNQSVLVARIAAGVHAKLAAAMVDANGNEVRSWLRVVAKNDYDLDFAPATFTKQRLTFTCEAGQGPQTVSAGAVARAPATGNRYLYNGADVVVPDGGTATADFTAEFSGSSFADSADTITELTTSLPGVSVANSPLAFGGVDALGAALRGGSNAGTGSVTPSGTPALSRKVTVEVTASGAAGVSGGVEIRILRAGVTTATDLSPIPTTYDAGDGVTLTFDDGIAAGWIAGDMHTFSTPGSPIINQGVDDESNSALLARCLGRWPSLSSNVVTDKFVGWVRQCSTDNGFGIEKITVRASSTVAGEVDVVVATAAGAPAGGTVATLQDYVTARQGITDKATVAAADNVGVRIQGRVTVRRGDLTAVRADADRRWAKYVLDLPIGGDLRTGHPGVVRLAALERALSDAGVIDVEREGDHALAFSDNIDLDNGKTNLELGTFDVAVVLAGQEPSNALEWVSVPG